MQPNSASSAPPWRLDLTAGLTAAAVTRLVLQVREGRPAAVEAAPEAAYSD